MALLNWFWQRLRGAAGSDDSPGADSSAQGPYGREETRGPVSPERRWFLIKLSAAAAGLGAVVVGIPVVSVLFSPVIRRAPDVWRAVGGVEDFPIGETVAVSYVDPEPLPWAGFAATSAAWLRREDESTFVAFSIYCTHTGCPLRWEEGANLFMCPCHGGAFYRDGAVAAGPPPRPLPHVPVRVREGQVEIFTLGVPIAE